MKKVILDTKLIKDGKSVGVHRIMPTKTPVTIGAAKECRIRLAGPDVSLFHAVLEWRGTHWAIHDFASEKGTWIKNKSIVEYDLKENIEVQIGEYVIQIEPKVFGYDLFSKDTKTKSGELNAQQIVIKGKSGVLESKIISKEEPFIYFDGSSSHNIPVAKSSKWETTEIGQIQILARLVHESVEPVNTEIQIDKELRTPAFVTGLVLVLLMIIGGLIPQEPKEKELPNLNKNKFAKMIYSAKIVQKRREKALKLTRKKFNKSSGAQTPTSNQKAASNSKKVGAKKIITNIRATGLNKLIGKIAKRASSTVAKIQANGVIPDKSSGRALASVGNLNLGAVSGKSGGKKFSLKGVATKGLGGGSKDYKSGSTLKVGSVGAADVGMLDEESEVEGGLDREVIAEIIKRNIGQIRYCYERQLSANPELYGKVQVRFVIGPNGKVDTQNVGSSTLKNAMVEGCILRRVARWKFPSPKGGTAVRVTYPFLFKSTQ